MSSNELLNFSLCLTFTLSTSPESLFKKKGGTSGIVGFLGVLEHRFNPQSSTVGWGSTVAAVVDLIRGPGTPCAAGWQKKKKTLIALSLILRFLIHSELIFYIM